MGVRLGSSFMWKAVGKSVAGTSHSKGEVPCQDFCDYWHCQLGDEHALIIGIADGAGSAALAHVGSRETVGCLMQQAASCGHQLEKITAQVVRGWIEKTLEYLAEVAARENTEQSQLACTVLLAILGENQAVFAQIGDGGWVVDYQGNFEAVTWPFNGDFVNQTKFITSPDALDFLQFARRDGPLSAAAGFTDGMQSLALKFADKSVHGPFFEAMFAALRESDDSTSLLAPLIAFLSSERVNERTDDDKTLVLAHRCPDGRTGHVVD